jgi:hypothetical protein
MKRLVLFSVALGFLTATGCEKGLDPVGTTHDADVPLETVVASDNGWITSGVMSGGGILITPDGEVPLRGTFAVTVYCDPTQRSHMLVRWPGGNTFLLNGPMTGPTGDPEIPSAVCQDADPASAASPSTPFDTYYGVGIGCLNGVGGHQINFLLRDGGEPGMGIDKAAFVIMDLEENVVVFLADPAGSPEDPLSYLIPLEAGNLQARYAGGFQP